MGTSIRTLAMLNVPILRCWESGYRQNQHILQHLATANCLQTSITSSSTLTIKSMQQSMRPCQEA